MSEITEYALFMKMLEIIELKQRSNVQPPTPQEQEKIIAVIKNIEGNLFLTQDSSQEVNVNIEGDKFENISNSIIATRGSIASGIIKVRETEGDEVADALEQLEQIISQVDPKTMSDEEKEKALKLLEELTKQASSPNKTKVVLEAIGNSLWAVIKNVDPIVKAVATVWPIVQNLWI